MYVTRTLSPILALFICVMQCCGQGLYETASTWDPIHLSNLNTSCLNCIRSVAANMKPQRAIGFFKIQSNYWEATDRVILKTDEKQRGIEAFKDCANNKACAEQMVVTYMKRFGRDYNADGVTNCEDYLLLHLDGNQMLPADRQNLMSQCSDFQ